jgi:hypothetical protein
MSTWLALDCHGSPNEGEIEVRRSSIQNGGSVTELSSVTLYLLVFSPSMACLVPRSSLFCPDPPNQTEQSSVSEVEVKPS